MDFHLLKNKIENIWGNRDLLKKNEYKNSIYNTIKLLDEGVLRVANYIDNKWEVNEWIKKSIILYFLIQNMEVLEVGIFEYYDKIPLKKNFLKKHVRVVPNAVARYGSFIAPKSILMPSYVNIGAYIDEGTMVDTWATVGSCAQVGKYVHLSGGVGIGGVLEPLQANPVIIEDNVFVGSRCIIVEGVIVQKEAVLGAGVVLTGSTKIIDISGPNPIDYKGFIPSRSVVIPGTYAKKFPSGIYNVPCALIIGQRKQSTDQKTSLNETLRIYNVAI